MTKDMDNDDLLLEQLASLGHEQWVTWAKQVLDTEPGLSPTRKNNWRQYMRPYNELPEEIKEYNREWARKVCKIFKFFCEDFRAGKCPHGASK